MSRKTHAFRILSPSIKKRNKRLTLAESRAHYVTTLLIQLIRTLSEEGVVVFPSEDIRPAHRDDVLDVTVLPDGGIRLAVLNEDLSAQIEALRKEYSNTTKAADDLAT